MDAEDQLVEAEALSDGEAHAEADAEATGDPLPSVGPAGGEDEDDEDLDHDVGVGLPKKRKGPTVHEVSFAGGVIAIYTNSGRYYAYCGTRTTNMIWMAGVSGAAKTGRTR